MILEFLFSLNETTLILLTIFFYIAALGKRIMHFRLLFVKLMTVYLGLSYMNFY